MIMITGPKEQKILEIIIRRMFYAYESGAWWFIFPIYYNI